MCNGECLGFGRRYLSSQDVLGRRVIEIGSYDVNGSLRPIIQSFKPSEYVGVDIINGYGVDLICSAEDVRDKFGDQSFDLVVSTEMIEHIRNWRKIITNIKHILRPNGVVLLTTRSEGFPYHGYPFDFWRYDSRDMERIFNDCIIEHIEQDRSEPGVFIKARKPDNFLESDLSSVALYSAVTGTRIIDLDEQTLQEFRQQHGYKYVGRERQSLKKKITRALRDNFWKLKRI